MMLLRIGIISILLFIPRYFSFHIPYYLTTARNRFRILPLWQLLHSLKDQGHHHDESLRGMIRFFGEDMIDPVTNRFYYFCRPFDGICEHVHMPIRDLAAAWDATKAINFLDDSGDAMRETLRQSLKDAVKCTLASYFSYLDPVKLENCLSLSEDFLLEPANIGHSALLLVGACSALESNIVEEGEINDIKSAIDGLARGILSMQLPSGEFRTIFRGDGDFIRGIAFYPGEAILALVTAYECNLLNIPTKKEIIPSAVNAFNFYSEYHKTADVDANYNIWQVMAFSRLYDYLHNQRETQKDVASYILIMCREICQSKSWKYQLSRGQSFYVNLETVEIACGLDALAEGIRVAKLEKEIELASLFEVNAANAVCFLQWVQSRVPSSCVVGRGGLGYGGVCVLEQRLDVTGHAMSAFIKLQKVLNMDTC
ncbi:hypothetical protein ACHAW6_007455 [Cyclotella cf. meneghiniana]